MQIRPNLGAATYLRCLVELPQLNTRKQANIFIFRCVFYILPGACCVFFPWTLLTSWWVIHSLSAGESLWGRSEIQRRQVYTGEEHDAQRMRVAEEIKTIESAKSRHFQLCKLFIKICGLWFPEHYCAEEDQVWWKSVYETFWCRTILVYFTTGNNLFYPFSPWQKLGSI